MENNEIKYLSIQYGKINNFCCNIHKSNGTSPAKEMHYHDFFQIYFVTSGILTHHSEHDNIELVSGDCFIVPPYFKHYISTGNTTPVFYSFSFREEFLSADIVQNNIIKKLLDILTPQDTLLKLSLTSDKIQQLKNLLEYSLLEFEEQLQGWECSLQGLLSYILILFSRTYTEGAVTVFNNDFTMQNCIEYINLHFRENISLKNILDRFHFSYSTFLRSFRSVTGNSFRSYLIEKRIDHACKLLRETNNSISSICNECGYWDYSSFYRAFYNKTKTSPFKYRSISNIKDN